VLSKDTATVRWLLYCHWISDGMLEKVDSGGKAPRVDNRHVVSCLLTVAIDNEYQTINEDSYQTEFVFVFDFLEVGAQMWQHRTPFPAQMRPF
jgi:hypothetical protein